MTYSLPENGLAKYTTQLLTSWQLRRSSIRWIPSCWTYNGLSWAFLSLRSLKWVLLCPRRLMCSPDSISGRFESRLLRHPRHPCRRNRYSTASDNCEPPSLWTNARTIQVIFQGSWSGSSVHRLVGLSSPVQQLSNPVQIQGLSHHSKWSCRHPFTLQQVRPGYGQEVLCSPSGGP